MKINDWNLIKVNEGEDIRNVGKFMGEHAYPKPRSFSEKALAIATKLEEWRFPSSNTSLSPNRIKFVLYIGEREVGNFEYDDEGFGSIFHEDEDLK
jgi:hypothetical protein